MESIKYPFRFTVFLFTISLFSISYFLPFAASAQEKEATPTSQEFYNEIAYQDSLMFAAFNTQEMEAFRSMFTDDLEWYQDNGGLIPYETVFKNFEINFHREYKLNRQLVPGSLEVHPIKDYGAIEIGSHQFRHVENGKEVVGTFKFVMIWQKKNGNWKVSRVISYDH